ATVLVAEVHAQEDARRLEVEVTDADEAVDVCRTDVEQGRRREIDEVVLRVVRAELVFEIDIAPEDRHAAVDDAALALVPQRVARVLELAIDDDDLDPVDARRVTARGQGREGTRHVEGAIDADVRALEGGGVVSEVGVDEEGAAAARVEGDEVRAPKGLEVVGV